MTDYTFKKDNLSINCFGKPTEGSDFKINRKAKAEGELFWATGVPDQTTEEQWLRVKDFKSANEWDRVCEFLLEKCREDIVEITVVNEE